MGFISSIRRYAKAWCPSMCSRRPRSHSSRFECDRVGDIPGSFQHEEELVDSIAKDPEKGRRFLVEQTTDARLSAAVEKRSSSEDSRCECPFEEAVAVVVEAAEDPYEEFRGAMEEMVEAKDGAVDCKWLQEMLEWYLAVNSRPNHVFIVEAFMDLTLKLLALPC